ncbi:MAG: hypothetical protein OXB92_10775 [Acidimicrobiaceae bacterium]|nr:hypothetical protein [Acidimicrobiia bacterium]MCY4494327.1 hypothetical protein [Acidimicrobiaceae bacterium]
MTASMQAPEGATVHEGVEGWTVDGSSDDQRILDDATALLNAELPDPRFVSSDYLRWAYRENPLGRAIERHQIVAGGGKPRLVAHYANMPRVYRGPDGERANGAWSQNAVVHADHQRTRHFSRIGLEIYDEAAARGWSFVVGVTNEKSSGAVVKYMGWRLAGPLPVRVISPLGRGARRIRHIEVSAGFLDSGVFEEFAAAVDRHRVGGWATDYTPEVLRWRLACPHTQYHLHVADDVALITARAAAGPIPACVVLKLFPLTSSNASVDATRAIRSATRRHRGAFAVYAGFNGSVRVHGVRPPRRLQPSPLNLIIRHLDPTVDQDAITLDTFEFLDMDAY